MSKDVVESEFENYEGEPEAVPEALDSIGMEVDERQVSEWLSWLSDGVPGLVEVGIAPVLGAFSRRRFAAVQDAIEFVVEKAAHANAHPAMTTRIDDSSGMRSNVHSTRVLWAELDPPKVDEKGDALRLSIGDIEQFKAGAVSQISTFEPKPTAVLDSGNGLHLIWGLDAAFDLRSEEQKQAFEETLIGLAKSLGAEGDLAVTECARVMRSPGTINLPNAKKRALGRVSMPCRVLQWDRERRYSFNDFASFRDRGREAWGKRRRSGIEMVEIKSDWSGGVPAEVSALLNVVDEDGRPGYPDLVLRWHANTAGLKDRSGSGVDQSIANQLIALGVDPQDVARALITRSADRGDEAKGDSYYSHTITKAVRWCGDPVLAERSEETEGVDGDEDKSSTRYAVADGSDESYAVVFRDTGGLGDRWLYLKARNTWFWWNGTVFSPSEAGVRSELWRLEEPLHERARAAEARVAEYEAELEKLGDGDGPPDGDGGSSGPENPAPQGETGYHKALRSSAAKHQKAAKKWHSMARGIRDEHRRSSVATTLAGMLRVEPDELDANRDLLTFPASLDGRWPAMTVELDSLVDADRGAFDPQKVRCHHPTPNDRITMHMGCPWMPGTRNVESENVIRQILPDDELRATALQEMA